MAKRLTRAQVNKIKDIISNHMEVLMQITKGEGTPSKSLVNKLKLPNSIKDLITSAYKYGKARILSDADIRNMLPEDADKLIESIRLTPSQQY